jgi:hypothetical protein
MHAELRATQMAKKQPPLTTGASPSALCWTISRMAPHPRISVGAGFRLERAPVPGERDPLRFRRRLGTGGLYVRGPIGGEIRYSSRQWLTRSRFLG